ncbi:hypothetical protein [Mucilaginibacter paludis]|uniref:Uncharacterized protein n=1 Tax=Mucilaginibacter paludis DSM 18603 TaxID=714943 RepID=H1YFK4_9SPHI|nr:hypothetical protein [Mucilaginibacter paludis]EHQ24406.1 hypothetical protein Mucpa_0206 [Mucilaginibacter paludis DSM 18603]
MDPANRKKTGMTFEPYRLLGADRKSGQRPDCTPGRELASRAEGSGSLDFFGYFLYQDKK